MAPMTDPTTYRLVRSESAAVVPELDEQQRRVVDHPGGPLLVLAGPGTGKTTTLVEAIVDRIETRGARPEEVLALTFSRKAAEQLRDRVTARLGRTMSTSLSSTFHSFAYSLVRRYAPAELYAEPLRLLSAPEQDVVLQRLLTDAPESVRWPDSLRRAVGTRGFAREVLDVLGRAREKGLDGEALRELGEAHALPEFTAAGRFLDQYLEVLDQESALDYADLIRRAVLEATDHRDELRSRFRHVFVDEYQDTDPSQVALLRALAGDGRDLTVVGDPHQSIYAFRGAEIRGILEFPQSFPRSDGGPADVIALGTTRRFGSRLLLASQRVAARLALPGTIPAAARERFLSPATDPSVGEGRVDVRTFDSERAEAEHLADLLRRAHLEDGIGWSQMAVLVRSGRSTIPPLRRALAAAGVPVEVASDDTPLVAEPALQPLLQALRLVAHLDAGPDDPRHVPTDAVLAVLASPLAGLDATDVRTVARALRARETVTAAAESRTPRPSADLVRAAVLDPELLAGHDTAAARRTRQLATLLAQAREALEAGRPAEEIAWLLWSGTRWPDQLRERVAAGGSAARLAHRDLDAVCAFFDELARLEGHDGFRSFAAVLDTLRAQQIPADTLAERGVRGEAVRLLTAHRAKGLEWRLVVVAHVQEEVWPDLRRRDTLLRPDRIGAGVLQEPTTTREMLAEERRLFYVACTRARERLVVTAVRATDDDGEQPSRFLAELLPEGADLGDRHRTGRPSRPLSLGGLVAELRRTAADPAEPEALRRAAARRLRRLASETDRDGRQLVPSADPASWWGLRRLSRPAEPLREPDVPITLSASTVSEILECPARWFLQREAGGAEATSQAQGFGNIAHALADRVAREDAEVAGLDADGLMGLVDQVWGQLSFRTPWSQGRERGQLRDALDRFLTWQARAEARPVAASEATFRVAVALPDGQQVILRGRADRLEVDAEGRIVVVDLKTGKYPPPDSGLAENPQLGFYQYAVAHGAADGLVPDSGDEPVVPGGAELWQLRKASRGWLKVQVQPPQQPDDEGLTLAERQIMQAARVIRDEELEARPGAQCERCQFARMCPTQQAGTVLE